jgi:hypothetical protein
MPSTERGQSRLLIASDDAELRTCRFGLEDRSLPLPGQALEAVGVEQRLVELSPLADVPLLAVVRR